MNRNFHGGIHNSDGSDKQLSNRLPIKHYIPDTVEISMRQSGGSICKPLVSKGDNVTKGQLIGIPTHYAVANIHASISGTVTEINSYTDEFDREVPIIVIKAKPHIQPDNTESKSKANPQASSNQQNNTDARIEILHDYNTELNEADYHNKLVDTSAYKREDILTSMKEGGLIGLGGAGFPTNIKYETSNDIQYILVNAAECEPYLSCDHRVMLDYGYDLINGIMLLIKAANADKAFICIEDNKKDAASYLESILEGKGLPIEIKVLTTRYPQGGERQLIEAVIKKEVPAGKLPADLGVIVNNVGTIKALADIIFTGEPLTDRVITITGKVKNPGNYYVPIGTRYSELIKLVGGVITENYRIIVGGPMTGTSIMIGGDIKELQGSVLKTSSGLLVLEDYTLVETPCIRCGECERVCPAGLAPFKIDFAAINDDISLCDKLYATECISCGACSYVCPANRELAYRITEAKMEILSLRRQRGEK